MRQKFSVLKDYGKRGKGHFAPDDIIIKSTKALHLLAATAWAGGALSMQALSYLKLSTSDPVTITHMSKALHFVDTVVVIPGLFGCLLTGLFYSVCTAIGFVKYAWIGFKWLISLAACFWGLMFWGPWGHDLIDRLTPYGWDAPLRFVRACILPENMWEGALQLVIILIMCLISVYRPLSFRLKKDH